MSISSKEENEKSFWLPSSSAHSVLKKIKKIIEKFLKKLKIILWVVHDIACKRTKS